MKTKRQKIVKKLDKITTEIVRRRDVTCQKCGRFCSGSNAHKSHIKSKGAYPHLQFDLQNVMLLCYHCHINWWHKEPTEAGLWFKKTFPERYKYLEKAKQDKNHYMESDLEEMYERYKEMLEKFDTPKPTPPGYWVPNKYS